MITADNREIPVLSFRGTVADVLEKANVTLRRADIVEPALDSPVKNIQQIKVMRVSKEELVYDQLIEFNIRKKKDRKLLPGQQQVVQYGSCGTERIYYQVTYKDGQEYKREEVRKEVVKEPQPMVVAYGMPQVASRSQERTMLGAVDLKEKGQVTTFISTAYTHTGYRTASGIMPHRGVVSVDTRVIPLGTKLYVENYGPAVALDTGGDIKGNRIDVFFETRQEAIKWGRRTVKVRILE